MDILLVAFVGALIEYKIFWSHPSTYVAGKKLASSSILSMVVSLSIAWCVALFLGSGGVAAAIGATLGAVLTYPMHKLAVAFHIKKVHQQKRAQQLKRQAVSVKRETVQFVRFWRWPVAVIILGASVTAAPFAFVALIVFVLPYWGYRKWQTEPSLLG